MRIHGWGCYPAIDAEVLSPLSTADCWNAIQYNPVITRGMGRSYGDSANATTVVQTTYLDHYVAFDSSQGLVTCESGVTLRELLTLIVPKGWFLPVTPGTSYVTVGGAIASDVHGKNHHVAGTFSQYVQSLTLLLGTGEVVTTSVSRMPDLYHATCGGMGLTGIILSAAIKLIPISSTNITQTTIKTRCIEETCEQFEIHATSSYSVAWIDCMAQATRLGRSILMLGEHADDNKLAMKTPSPIPIPPHIPPYLMNKWSIRAFNALYYSNAQHNQTQAVPFQPYFYPLDTLGNWNRLYGKQGFVQYQCVLPKAVGAAGIRDLLAKVVLSRTGSFLAVLKLFGAHNANHLSFPIEGYTLALDFMINEKTRVLIRELDNMIVDFGGKIYLAKDALMTETTFKSTYPRWEEFEEIRSKYGAIGKFSSTQSRRLGLQ